MVYRYELSKLLSFLPDSWMVGLNAQFEHSYREIRTVYRSYGLKGSAIGALSALPYAMAADVIDLDSAQTGKRQGGAYFSIWTMTHKLAYALGLVVVLLLQQLSGLILWPIQSTIRTALTRCYGSHACIPSCRGL